VATDLPEMLKAPHLLQYGDFCIINTRALTLLDFCVMSSFLRGATGDNPRVFFIFLFLFILMIMRFLFLFRLLAMGFPPCTSTVIYFCFFI
jgi:hypothetical protein